jgi:hypothetical protein
MRKQIVTFTTLILKRLPKVYGEVIETIFEKLIDLQNALGFMGVSPMIIYWQ